MASSSSSSPEMPPMFTSNKPSTASQKRLHECLEDLSSRFILNLPEVELASLERVCFQVEQAHWYYEDFLREEDHSLPAMTLKKFSSSLFAVCPFLRNSGHTHEEAFQSFLAYKTRVPVCGAIMLNETWDKCLLVKGWKNTAAWSFPKGKINESEPKYKCAIREVLEETGFDLENHINPDDMVESFVNEQSVSLFIVPNIPENFPFATRTRKEISKISWFRLADLPLWKRNRTVPGKFYLITPFIGPIKQYIREKKPFDVVRSLGRRAPNNPQVRPQEQEAASPATTESVPAASGPGSSSQSSDVDGEPPTPSPQCSEPAVNRLEESPHLANGVSEESIIPDSHLAFLLHSLTKSALPTPSASAELGVTPDPPILQAPQVENVLSHLMSTASVRSIPSPVKSPASASHTVRPSPTPSRGSTAHRSSSPFVTARSPVSQVPPVQTQASPVSPKTSRRSAGLSADISPYFTRAQSAAIPKQMKYLTMLENVAKESERMTPKLERQMQLANGLLPSFPSHPNSVNHGPPHPRLPSSSMGEPLSFSTGPGVGANFPPGFIPNSNQHDPFTVRPRTSNAFHPVSYPPHFSRASMNEDQLRLMMAGGSLPQPPPPMPHGFPPLNQPRQGFPLGNPPPIPLHGFVPPPPQLAQPPLRVVPPSFLPNGSFNEPGPLSAPPISPAYTLAPRPNPANNAQLLSILNQPNIPRAMTTIPAAATNGHS